MMLGQPYRAFITGTAGFIGFHLAKRLLDEGHFVYGFDGLTEYYDVGLKLERLRLLEQYPNYQHTTAMLEDMPKLCEAAERSRPDIIVHLAAQAGVRYSLENPRSFVDSNLVGSFNVLEIARQIGPAHLLLASTSSVYGANDKIPFAETDPTDQPLTLYAATKKSMEVMAHSYAHLWGIPTTVFRFFTVYGPHGRPDMALFKFVEAARAERPIDVYGAGHQERDFTFIDDLIEAVFRLIPIAPCEDNRVTNDACADSLSRRGPYRIVNLGGGRPVGLIAFIEAVEAALGQPIARNLLPMQKGDVPRTFASPELLESLSGYAPQTEIGEGVAEFVQWHKGYSRRFV
jgi:UDP-glucuronate 4-epimerase